MSTFSNWDARFEKMIIKTQIEDPVELTISPEKVVFLIEKAREFDVKDAPTKADPGSNPSDDGMIEVLEDHPDDPVLEEITGLIGSLNEDEQIELVALMWLGREDYDSKDWDQPRRMLPRPITTERYAT